MGIKVLNISLFCMILFIENRYYIWRIKLKLEIFWEKKVDGVIFILINYFVLVDLLFNY